MNIDGIVELAQHLDEDDLITLRNRLDAEITRREDAQEARDQIEEFRALPEDEQEALVFEYLVDLRDSGIVNMFGSAPYVAEVFGMNDREASAWVSRWMKSF